MAVNADISVSEVMDREYVGVSESDDLVDTVELLLREDEEVAVVQRGGECVGTLTERDVLAAVVEGPPPDTASVVDVMSETVPAIDPQETVSSAASEMAARRNGHLVVTDNGEARGLITERDILTARPYRTGDSAADATEGEPIAPRATSADEEPVEGEFADQGICEQCGTLASDLVAVDGQVRCPDCRSL